MRHFALIASRSPAGLSTSSCATASQESRCAAVAVIGVIWVPVSD
jgi:hypothetical protein